MEVSLLPDCDICRSPYVEDIEKMYRGNHKILPIAKEYSEKFSRPISTMRVWLTTHFDNLHSKYRKKLAQEDKEKRIDNILESENINFDDYKDAALRKAMLQLAEGSIHVKPTDIAALENIGIAKQKLGLDKQALKLQMAKMYGGFFKKQEAVEGEVVDESRGLLPEVKG